MNYRKLFVAAFVLNLVLAGTAYWLWKSPRRASSNPASPEHPPMEGFTINTPPEGAPPPLTPVELTPERMQSIGVRTGRVEYKNIESDIRATGSVEVDERRLSYV